MLGASLSLPHSLFWYKGLSIVLAHIYERDHFVIRPHFSLAIFWAFKSMKSRFIRKWGLLTYSLAVKFINSWTNGCTDTRTWHVHCEVKTNSLSGILECFEKNWFQRSCWFPMLDPNSRRSNNYRFKFRNENDVA